MLSYTSDSLENRRETGQGLAEYALIIVLVAVVVIVVLLVLGDSINNLFVEISDAIGDI